MPKVITIVVATLALLAFVAVPATAPAIPAADAAPGGPILVVTATGNKFTRYLAEILQAEGLNAYATADVSALDATLLADYKVVVLGETALTAGQVTDLTGWVNAGGNLIAMRPDAQLFGLLGVTSTGGNRQDQYLKLTASPAGAGIVTDSIQYHGTATRYTLAGATAVATLYTTPTNPTPNPAVTLRSVGSAGGEAAAFAFDLARSVVYTRQGRPGWAGQERDGIAPIRPDDLFFGASASNPQPDWVDLNKVAIPQADEQQRLLANLITRMARDVMPIPRFWYFPRDEKAVIVMTGDDHASGGTAGRFDSQAAQSPPGCSVADWECIRSTSYIYTGTPLSNAQAAAYDAQGFEVALHVDTNCANWTPAQLESFFSTQLAAWQAKYTSVPAPVTNRTHCITWSDWASHPKTELAHGIRFDTNYYYWPPDWIQNRPGMFTGSGMPMRFADLDGTVIDVYQGATQMTDESGQTYPFTVNTLLDRATGPEGYYGAFVANMHTDSESSAGATAIISSALARGVPVVSSRQMLTWLDGRNASSFGSLAYSGGTMSFTIAPGAGANGLRALLPASTPDGPITGLTLGGSPGAVHGGGRQGHRVRALRRRRRQLRGDVRGRHRRPRHHRRAGRSGLRRYGRRDLDDRRAVQLARRLRHEPRLAHVLGHLAGHDDEPQRDADGPRGLDDVPLPRHLDRLLGELHHRAQPGRRSRSRRRSRRWSTRRRRTSARGRSVAGTYLAQAGDGEVVLAPLVGSEFSGSSLPSGLDEHTVERRRGVDRGERPRHRRRGAPRDRLVLRPRPRARVLGGDRRRGVPARRGSEPT